MRSSSIRAGQRTARLVVSASLCLAGAGCGGGPSGPAASDALTVAASSAHYDFRFTDGDMVDASRQEAFHDWAVVQLGVIPTRRIQYNKYRDRSHMQRVTGQLTNGWADPPNSAVHSIWTWDTHEAVHIYTALIGRPSDFFNEGIAVALSVDPMEGRFVSLWNNVQIDDIARNLLRSGTLPSVGSISTTDAFRQMPDQTSYPVAGSFVSYLLRVRGSGPVRTFFQTSSRNDSEEVIRTRFIAAFGTSLASVESAWRLFLAE